MYTQALKDLFELLDSDTAKHIDKLEQYKQMLEEMEEEGMIKLETSLSYETITDMIDSLEDIRGVINE